LAKEVETPEASLVRLLDLGFLENFAKGILAALPVVFKRGAVPDVKRCYFRAQQVQQVMDVIGQLVNEDLV
jgi:hypothetical protein